VIHYRNQSKFYSIVQFGSSNRKKPNDQKSMCSYSDMFYDSAIKCTYHSFSLFLRQ